MLQYYSKGTTYKIISGIIAVVLTIYAFVSWKITGNTASDAFLHNQFILVIGVYIWSFVAWGATGHRYSCIYIVFLIYTFTSNAGQMLIKLIDPNGVYSFVNMFEGFSNASLCKVCIFQAMFVACMNFGAIVGAGSYLEKGQIEVLRINDNNTQKSILFKFVFAGLFILVLYDAISFTFLRRSVTYAEGYGSASNLGTYSLYAFSVLMFYEMFKADGKRLRNLLIVVGAISALYFLNGTRSKALPLLGCMLVIMRIKYPKLFRFRNLLIASPVVLLLISLGSAIAFARTGTLGSLSLISIVSEKGILYMVKQGIYEMGMSARTIATTISEFERGSMAHEQTILYSLILAIIPRPLLEMIGISAPAIGALSTFATGGSASGAGFSCVAEFFFDFGLWASIPSFIYGFVITRLEGKASDGLKYGRFIFAAIVYTILCKQIFFARGQFDYVYNYLRNTFYIILIWVVMNKGKITIRKNEWYEQSQNSGSNI